MAFIPSKILCWDAVIGSSCSSHALIHSFALPCTKPITSNESAPLVNASCPRSIILWNCSAIAVSIAEFSKASLTLSGKFVPISSSSLSNSSLTSFPPSFTAPTTPSSIPLPAAADSLANCLITPGIFENAFTNPLALSSVKLILLGRSVPNLLATSSSPINIPA